MNQELQSIGKTRALYACRKISVFGFPGPVLLATTGIGVRNGGLLGLLGGVVCGCALGSNLASLHVIGHVILTVRNEKGARRTPSSMVCLTLFQKACVRFRCEMDACSRLHYS